MKDLMPIEKLRDEFKAEKEQILTGEVRQINEILPTDRNIQNSITTAEKIMDAVVGQAIIVQAGDDETKQHVLKTAKKVIDTKISEVKHQTEKKEKEAVFSNNKDACDLFGINEKTVPKWVVNIAVAVQNFWYAIWLVIGSVTTAPIVFLGKKIKVVVKNIWVAMLLAAIIYILAVLSPLWVRLINLIK